MELSYSLTSLERASPLFRDQFFRLTLQLIEIRTRR
jgi:hypothetical protein